MTQRVDKDSLLLDKPRRTPGHPTKSHIVKTNVGGKEKIIRFGEQGAETAGKPKAGESDRMKQKRASFKSRHAKNIAKGKSSPAYWANKVKWAEGGAVKMAAGGALRMPRVEGAALQLIEQMRRAGGQEEFNPVLASTREQRRARPARQQPPAATKVTAPLAAMRAPEPREAPLPLPPTPPAMRPDENPPPEAPRNPMRFDEGNPHVATAISMAQRYNLPPSVFLSLVEQESGFNPAARSRRGAIGLGQLMPATAKELGVDPHDPEQNLEGSARYFRQMLDRFGSMELALAAYNAGPGRVRRAGNTIPNIRETQQYVPSVLRRAGASTGPEYAEGGLADLDQKYAEGGEVRTPEDEEYDRRLLSRMKAHVGRVTEPTRAEQMQALRTAGREAAEGVADVLLPQSPLDLALMAAFGPGGRAARLAGSAALASLEPSEAEASRLRRLIRAYHGSPHRFDEFDISKVGTGEGAQAYGRGLYFAENEGIAKHYRNKLSPLVLTDPQSATDQAKFAIFSADGDKRIARELLEEDLAFYTNKPPQYKLHFRPIIENIQETINAIDGVEMPGHMYEVNLNAAPREFLNWDAPLSQQSREVQESLRRFGLQSDLTGEDIYKRALRMDPEEARVALMEAGVPGTRYLDANSRGVGGGTYYNYAVFDPEIIDIQRRYARGGLAELEHKYAEGGAVNAEPMPYNADAVDALVKQIEAEYV